MSDLKVNCLLCNKELEIDGDDFATSDRYFIPSIGDAIVCESHGNYGSSIFDPLHENEILQFYVCDQCLLKNADKIKHFKISMVRETHILEKGTFADFRAGRQKEVDRYQTLKNKHVEARIHLWYPVPAAGKFKCTVCDRYIDSALYPDRKSFNAAWSSECPGRATKELKEVKE